MLRIVVIATAYIAGCGRLAFEELDLRSDSGAPGTARDGAPGASDGVTGDGSMGTFGSMEVGISTQNTGTDRVWMSKFMLSEPAMLHQLVAHFAPTGGQSSSVRGVVYADAGDVPTTLLGTTNVVVASTMQATWVPLPFAVPIALTPGMYWLGTHNTAAIGIAYQSATGASRFNNDLFSDGPDATYAGGATTYNLQLSIHAEYTR